MATAPRPPVVVGIPGGGELHMRRAIAAGAKVVFRKPVEWERIVAFLRKLRAGPCDVTDVAS
jgi:DNA-binding NarL/FixJ family response regulator